MDTSGMEVEKRLGRKRQRSAECHFVGQSKQYVNENLANSKDDAKMTEIYSNNSHFYPFQREWYISNLFDSDKTMSLLFKGSSNHFSQITGDKAAPMKDDPAADATSKMDPPAELSDRERLKLVRLLGSGQFKPLINGKVTKTIPALQRKKFIIIIYTRLCAAANPVPQLSRPPMRMLHQRVSSAWRLLQLRPGDVRALRIQLPRLQRAAVLELRQFVVSIFRGRFLQTSFYQMPINCIKNYSKTKTIPNLICPKHSFSNADSPSLKTFGFSWFSVLVLANLHFEIMATSNTNATEIK